MKILIVDDQEENRYLLETMLKASGNEVVSATNGAEAFEKLHAEAFDMIIADILMPVMDGFQLCREVKRDENLKSILFVFYTATYTDAKDEKFALELGADKFIRKPVEPDEFIKILHDVSKSLKKGNVRPKNHILEDEKEILKLYSERLVKKLEKKMLDLEREITERKKAEKALQREKDFSDAVINSSPGPLFIFGEKGNIIRWNNYVEKFTGYSASEIAKMNVLDFVVKDDQKTAIEAIQEVLTNGQASIEINVLTKSEKKIPFYIIGRRTKIENITCVVCTGMDITERKRAEEALQQSYHQLRETFYSVVNALTSTVEKRDPYTAGHQRRTTILACAIAEEMELPVERIEGIRMAGSIHDIGKIEVPTEILSRPGSLTDVQYEMVKIHPRTGHDILKGIKFPWPVAEIVLQHHERMDGSGYPQGIKREKIMLEARILAVADVIEAMSSYRPYRPSLGTDKALEEISQNRGVLFDPDVVDACIRLFAEKEFKFE